MTIQPAAPLLDIRKSGKTVTLASLCGVPLAEGGPVPALGQVVINSNLGHFEGPDLPCQTLRSLTRGNDVVYTAGQSHLQVTSRWRVFPDTGIVRRRDTLTNVGSEPATISRCLARIPFPSGTYEIYSQQSRWCHENQGAWNPLHAGDTVLRCVSGRTTLGGTPYACLHETHLDTGLIFHLLPEGNWIIRIRAVTIMDALPLAVAELGLNDENLRLELAPGASIKLPELLFQSLTGRQPHRAAPAFHRHVLKQYFQHAKPFAPVVYNTWFDEFERLDPARLKRQLKAAKTAGCEMFVIDAGWYGAGTSSWWAQAGDWREKTTTAFRGHMRRFADQVRAAGLKFGIWMEPERIGPDAPILKQHPDWFIPVPPSARINLEHPDAYAWLRNEIGRLVKTYGLAWMKLDFNFDVDTDPSGAELSGYTRRWYHLLDDVRAAYPRTFFEGCASGGLRSDLHTLIHHDSHFLSDTVKPIDVLRISQGAYLRLPPGRLGHWACLRSAGSLVPRYGLSTAQSPATLLVAGGALWEPAETVNLDFFLLTAMSGMLGFSGDMAGLPKPMLNDIALHVRFFKRWRRFLASSICHLLTPPEPMTEHNGWVVFQFQDPASTTSLVYVYRLGLASAVSAWPLRNLLPGKRYRITEGVRDRARSSAISGRELMDRGLPVKVAGSGGSRVCAAAIYRVERS